ncbi:kinase-like domain-containing protein [Rhizophagus irregularis DAOM 181602=DAOM 197198]|nr:kinase-like domain-containing protein [Rhizophagus irregularis DAOM 181602=DAOM 197198]
MNLEKKFALTDESLITEDEKSEIIKIICENCQDECLTTLYCEHFVLNITNLFMVCPKIQRQKIILILPDGYCKDFCGIETTKKKLCIRL